MKPERMIELAKEYGIRTLESIFPNPAYANAGNVRERELEIFANAVIEESTSELQKEVARLTRELATYEAITVTGSPTLAQAENTAFPTSYIPTTTARKKG